MQENRKVESGYACTAKDLTSQCCRGDRYGPEPEQEHFNFWYGLRTHPERLDDKTKKRILSTAPYKMMLFDTVLNP